MRRDRKTTGPRRRAAARLAAVLTAGLLTTTLSVAPAAAEDPEQIAWNDLLPGLEQGYDPSSSDVCRSGRLKCVDAVIREMERRWKPLSSGCDHRAVFSLLYLRTTEAYREAVTTPGFFDDPAFLNHYDAVFASYYFEQEDLWYSGRRSEVAPAWRVAFETAEQRGATGSGDMLLGMHGHINRDLPFVLAEIGLVAPDGTSRKADHDRVYEFLNSSGQASVAEVARRYDPTIDDRDVPGTTLDQTAVFQVIQVWRERAWRNAERLVAARALGPAAYAAVAEEIEQTAGAEARTLAAATGNTTSPEGPAQRQAWCAEHHDDR
ncbi:hypothetical protein CLV92_102352 [Kineococcus xinjiangensis]|uniref:Uncharacterized protein n=1 Tax=Kineococcus xinjiangensis TaxID=512762 RepID=A0A2S6IVI1_9ACTN|nr:DUF5995 family protein [Kineococcus xinjiangensis]PPK98199.1 hypothetical protein CLV92_102352 [Kineococcus xinjiangensis]